MPFSGGPSLNLQFAGSTTLDPRITFTRASTGTYTDSAGVLQSAAINVPRFDYSPTTLQPLGLLIEESRTNSALYSELFSNAAWVKSNTGVTADTDISPAGTTTADKLFENTANTSHFVTCAATSFISGTTYTFSVYAKFAGRFLRVLLPSSAFPASNRSATFNLQTGEIAAESGVTASAVLINNGWYRCSISVAATISTTGGAGVSLSTTLATGLEVYTGDGTSGAILWGAQLETGTFPTSYTPTTTAAATRAADAAVISTLTPWYSATAGTLFATASVMYGVGTAIDGVASLDDNSADNRIQIRRNSTNQIPSGVVVAGGTAFFNTGATGATAVAANAIFSIGLAYDTNNTIFGDRGLLSTVDTSVTLPTVTQLQIGNGAGIAALNGRISRLVYYPRRLGNAELQSLTV
jgi:hypothetical protein